MLEELTVADEGGWNQVLAAYTPKNADKLKVAKFNPEKLAQRTLLYEQIDLRLTELLLGAR